MPRPDTAYYDLRRSPWVSVTPDGKIRHSADDITYADLITFEEVAKWHRFRGRQRERAKAGVGAKREARSRAIEELRGRVNALRTKRPSYSRRAIARLLLSSGEPRDKKAIERMAARIRRLSRK